MASTLARPDAESDLPLGLGVTIDRESPCVSLAGFKRDRAEIDGESTIKRGAGDKARGTTGLKGRGKLNRLRFSLLRGHNNWLTVRVDELKDKLVEVIRPIPWNFEL